MVRESDLPIEASAHELLAPLTRDEQLWMMMRPDVAAQGSTVEHAPQELKVARVALAPGETRVLRRAVSAADLA
ncbi:MAG TPA: hypothetical protein VFZ66_02650 [Herpetosiphonaceae bacterium]